MGVPGRATRRQTRQHKIEPSQTIQGIDLAPILAYNSNAFYNRAYEGGEWQTNGVRNINEANIRADMAAMSMRLVNHVRTQMPDASLKDIIGGRRIVPATQVPTMASLPYATAVTECRPWPICLPCIGQPGACNTPAWTTRCLLTRFAAAA